MSKQAGQGPKGRKARLLHLAVSSPIRRAYWLHLEVRADTRLEDLDDFLRRIWLECCGHLSAFYIGNVSYSSNPEPDSAFREWLGLPRERSMRAMIGNVLRKGARCTYEYDFGTTTELEIRVVGEREAYGARPGIRLLARNEPPEILCSACGKPASQVCTECSYDQDGWLCEACALGHPCGEDILLPVVNSPRVGLCGYEGPAELRA